jgi:hypothetical protein
MLRLGALDELSRGPCFVFLGSRSAILTTEKNRANREPFCPSPASYPVEPSYLRSESMFYKKNLPVWERVARLAGAAAMFLCAARYAGTPAGWALGIVGAVFATTALIGFCPMCAIGGRKLTARQK